MSPIEKNKFEKEFIYDLILYIDYPDIFSKKTNTMTLDEFKQS
jgi:hypothetical protein